MNARIKKVLHRALWTTGGFKIELAVIGAVIAAVLTAGAIYYIDHGPPVRQDRGLIEPAAAVQRP